MRPRTRRRARRPPPLSRTGAGRACSSSSRCSAATGGRCAWTAAAAAAAGGGKGGRVYNNGGYGGRLGQQQAMYPLSPQHLQAFQQPFFMPAGTPVFYPPTAYGLPMAAAVNAPSLGQIEGAVQRQIEYYFSVENLCKDVFLRKKMDGGGWIPTAVIASFNRVRMLTPDLAVILEALRDSMLVETSGDLLSIRARDGWAQWVLPPEERDPLRACAQSGRVGAVAQRRCGARAPAHAARRRARPPPPIVARSRSGGAGSADTGTHGPGSDSGRGSGKGGAASRKAFASAPVTPNALAAPPPVSLGQAAERAVRAAGEAQQREGTPAAAPSDEGAAPASSAATPAESSFEADAAAGEAAEAAPASTAAAGGAHAPAPRCRLPGR